ncbi:hypothetical protein EDB84DRAFT_1222789 [Lactarius hengduanensis]|nr:hypothetical protein EDB84DRAFT_1222789 [Lactarius hengduanensis]
MPGVSTRAHGGYVDRQSREIGRLSGNEVWWRDHYDDIKSRGYQLRPRYDPGWVSSWRGSSSGFSVEAEQPYLSLAAMDATRLRDGKRVMLKKVLPEEGPHELQICLLFSSVEVAMNPHNHCVPLLEVIELSPRSGSQKLMVFPLLFPFNQPRIQTFGEFAAFFTQICEGIQFMHQLNVAHRDCTAENIMSSRSKMYPNRFLPAEIGRNSTFKGAVKAYTRARPPPRYYFVGLELSVQYPSRDTIDEPWRRGDTSAPEHQSGGLGRCNPFQTDIYYIGNLVSQEFVERCEGFEFMKDLVASMTQDDPAKRPVIEEVLQEFVRIRESLTKSKLRSAITSKDAPKVFGIIRQTRQSIRAVWHIVAGRPAIPDPYL